MNEPILTVLALLIGATVVLKYCCPVYAALVAIKAAEMKRMNERKENRHE